MAINNTTETLTDLDAVKITNTIKHNTCVTCDIPKKKYIDDCIALNFGYILRNIRFLFMFYVKSKISLAVLLISIFTDLISSGIM